MFVEIFGDETFERFKRDLAVFVLLATANGKRVSARWFDEFHIGKNNNVCCPMGCHPDTTSIAPSPGLGSKIFRIEMYHASEFQTAFGDTYYIPETCYGKLGRQYREMFP